MATKRTTKTRPPNPPRKRAPRPNNPYGIDNEEFTRLCLESSRMYVGKCVAWSSNHDRILAVGATFKEVDDELDRLGLDSSTAIHEFIAPYMSR